MKKKGFVYVPKNGKKAFIQLKIIFVKGSCYCIKCKTPGHIEKDYKNIKHNSYVSFDSYYVLKRYSNGSVKV